MPPVHLETEGGNPWFPPSGNAWTASCTSSFKSLITFLNIAFMMWWVQSYSIVIRGSYRGDDPRVGSSSFISIVIVAAKPCKRSNRENKAGSEPSNNQPTAVNSPHHRYTTTPTISIESRLLKKHTHTVRPSPILLFPLALVCKSKTIYNIDGSVNGQQ